VKEPLFDVLAGADYVLPSLAQGRMPARASARISIANRMQRSLPETKGGRAATPTAFINPNPLHVEPSVLRCPEAIGKFTFSYDFYQLWISTNWSC
jgi:hypothetical protein